MPAKTWNLSIGREYQGRDGKKMNWTQIGRMAYNAEKKSFSIFLDALPAHGEVIMAFEPKPKDDYKQGAGTSNYSQVPGPDVIEVPVDEIPF